MRKKRGEIWSRRQHSRDGEMGIAILRVMGILGPHRRYGGGDSLRYDCWKTSCVYGFVGVDLKVPADMSNF